MSDVLDIEVAEEETVGREIAVRTQSSGLADYTPDVRRTPEEVRESIERIERVAKEHMRIGVDVLTIPGTDKPTLTKAGAERMNKFYNFFMTEELVERVMEHEAVPPFIMYTYRVGIGPLDHEGKVVPIAVCEGSANSYESKWRWRYSKPVCPACQQETIIKGKAEYGGGWLCFKKQGGCGATYRDGDQAIEGQKTGRVPNDDVYSSVNAIQKIAQKRAYVGATLIATGTSEFFTQDMEDAAAETARPVDTPPQAPRPAASAEGPKNGSSGDVQAASAAQVRMLFALAARLGVKEATEEAVRKQKEKHGDVLPKAWAHKQIERLKEKEEQEAEAYAAAKEGQGKEPDGAPDEEPLPGFDADGDSDADIPF